MGLTLKFEHPHFPEGHKFSVNFLGEAINGAVIEIEEEAERLFVAIHGKTVEDALKNDALVTVTGTSALLKDETDQLIAQATPATTEETPEAPNQTTTEDEDPNQLILGGDNNA